MGVAQIRATVHGSQMLNINKEKPANATVLQKTVGSFGVFHRSSKRTRKDILTVKNAVVTALRLSMLIAT